MAAVKPTRDADGNIIFKAYPLGKRMLKQEELEARRRDDVLVSNAAELDDEFAGFFETTQDAQAQLIGTPYPLKTLELKVQTNNALGPCIDAMEANIDGTGFDLKTTEDDDELTPEQETKKDRLGEFFDEVWPGTSFLRLRRNLRRDLEITGMAYVEVIRNLEGKMIFLRQVRAKNIRMVYLDDPVVVQKTVIRDGEKMEVDIEMRERRYAQVVTSRRKRLVYFKEYGSSRDLHKHTGRWGTDGEPVDVPDRANELIQFGIFRDVNTPYFVPRWIGQTPSVVGSRMAEEQNVEFFKSGGVPPFIAFLVGGQMAETAQQDLDNMLSGSSITKQRGVAIEVYGTAGSIEKEGQVKVQIERFGSEKISDSMFENYDEKSELRVRRAFRLPPIFVGKAGDYSFATAFASYTVAEAQIFKPERDEFDEIINNTVMRELDPEEEFRFASRPLSVKDATMQLKALEMAHTASAIDAAGLLKALNETVNMDLQLSEGEDEDDDAPDATQEQPGAVPQAQGAGGQVVPIQPPAPGGPAPIQRTAEVEVASLATRAHRLMERVWADPLQMPALKRVSAEIDALSPEDRAQVHTLIAGHQFEDFDIAPEELAEAAGEGLRFMARRVG